MSAQHTPPGDRSFAVSLARHVGAGLGLIAVVALVFWGIGRFRGPESNPVIALPSDEVTTPAPSDGTTDPTTAPTDPATSPSAARGETPAATASPTATSSPTGVAPSEITVQVLDAAGDDGSKAAAAAEALRDQGYRVVAQNDAVRTYERSTLFYTEGHRADAERVQRDVPAFGVIEEKPSNLTDSVDVHAVVGEDYPG